MCVNARGHIDFGKESWHLVGEMPIRRWRDPRKIWVFSDLILEQTKAISNRPSFWKKQNFLEFILCQIQLSGKAKGEGHVPEKIVLEKKRAEVFNFFLYFSTQETLKRRERENRSEQWTVIFEVNLMDLYWVPLK